LSVTRNAERDRGGAEGSDRTDHDARERET
jgi:hypothetical protein